MKESTEKLILIIMSMVLGSLTLLLFQMVIPYTESSKINNYKTNCNNLSFEESINCLNDYINSIYNYTIRDESEYNSTNGNLEDILKNGGDCYDYSNLYVDLAKSLGFNGQAISFFPKDSKIGHRIALIYNEENNHLSQYCILDQTQNLGCIELGENNETV